jgi:hypothetical protein
MRLWMTSEVAVCHCSRVMMFGFSAEPPEGHFVVERHIGLRRLLVLLLKEDVADLQAVRLVEHVGPLARDGALADA